MLEDHIDFFSRSFPDCGAPCVFVDVRHLQDTEDERKDVPRDHDGEWASHEGNHHASYDGRPRFRDVTPSSCQPNILQKGPFSNSCSGFGWWTHGHGSRKLPLGCWIGPSHDGIKHRGRQIFGNWRRPTQLGTRCTTAYSHELDRRKPKIRWNGLRYRHRSMPLASRQASGNSEPDRWPKEQVRNDDECGRLPSLRFCPAEARNARRLVFVVVQVHYVGRASVCVWAGHLGMSPELREKK